MAKKNEEKPKQTQAIEQKKKPPPAAIQARDFLNARADKLSEWCVKGSGLTELDLVRIGTMVVSREPKFHNPKVWPSLYLSLITAGQLGLEPSGPMGEAYIIPYWDKAAKCHLAQLQPGYRGLIKLMTQSGVIKSVRSYVVHENDDFEMLLGSERRVHHAPCWKGDRGAPVAVYSIATFHDGDEDYELAPWSDVEKAKNSAKGKSPAWDTWPEQMARKFVIKRHANQLPLSPVARQAVDVDNVDTETMASDTQAIIDADVIEAPEEGPEDKPKSKLAGKLAKRKEKRQEREKEKGFVQERGGEEPKEKEEEKPPPPEDEEEQLDEMCSFCGDKPTDKSGAPCSTCRDEIAEAEAEEAGKE